MERRGIKLSPLKSSQTQRENKKNCRLSTEPQYFSSKKSARKGSFRPSCQINFMPGCQKMPNDQKSCALNKINSFEKRISTLNQTFNEKLISITSRQKENIMGHLRKKLKISSKTKASNLKPAERMMLEFQRELVRIKKAQNKNSGDEIRENRDRCEAFSSVLGQGHGIENEDSIKFTEGVYVLCDGHGSNGKQVSRFVCDNIFEKCLEKRKKAHLNKKIIAEIFQIVQRELEFSGIDIAFSGSTCLLLAYGERELIVGNLGDSQAYIKKECKIESLANQHVPTLPSESQRITSMGGVIRQLQICKGKCVGPMRIWAPGKNSWGPGVSLSRCFGNKAARRYGLISEPQIGSFDGIEDEHTIVIGSRALFEEVKIETIFNFVKKNSFENKQQACDELVTQALKKNEGETEKASIILIFA